MADLHGKRVAMVIARNFEDSEALDPKRHLESEGAEVVVIGVARQEYTGKKGGTLAAERTFADTNPGEYDALVIPGGGAPEQLRIDDDAVAFTREFVASGKPVAAICHGPQLLISAQVLAGRTLTSVKTIRDDVTNARGNYVDQEVTIDGNLITSRTPADLPAFNRALSEALAVAPVPAD
ncbi:MAG: type 1 glutamine amidotransferase domain-containing protein [Thermomicrobiales bacterium]|nr:type 1 glutamine amidotransferase domain-containing protein [Thermomicrobiales bacterium]